MVFVRFVFFLLCLTLLLPGPGCAPKRPLPPEVVRPLETSQDLLRRADAAWQARNHAESARLYGQLAWEPREDLDPRFLPAIRERLAHSLLHTGNFDQAVLALHSWSEADPAAQSRWAWHDLLVRALLGQGRQAEALSHLDQLMRRADAEWEVRYAAGVRLAELRRQARNQAAMAEVLAELYAMAPDEKHRLELERMTMHIAKGLADAELRSLIDDVGPDERLAFPSAVFVWEEQRRAASRDPGAWPEAWVELKRLLQRGEWTDRDIVATDLEELEDLLGRPSRCIGLVLPMDGPLAETGWKILRGAEAGRNTLALEGVHVRVEAINSLSPDLVESIRNMDAECMVIGGPVQRETWQRIQQAELHRERLYYAFLPALGEHEEGRLARRFFSSPQDHVRALAHLSVQSLGIVSNAVLYPEDRFGRHMMDLFVEEVARQGGVVGLVQGYAPAEHSAWGESVASLLGVQPRLRRGRAEGVQVPTPGFQALFIPDSLSQAEMLIPQLFYHDEPRLLILGPELWTQTWHRRMDQLESHYFRLAVMPGAWWPDNPSPATRALVRFAEESGTTPDFWMALGFDFVRWAASAQAQPAAKRQEQGRRPERSGDFAWSMAPLSWDKDGMARQDVYLFQPSSRGLEILDPEALRIRMERIRILHQR